MTDTTRTPARGTAPSNVARTNLLRRVRRLALPPEAVPRVARFVEREVEDALAARAERTFTLDDLHAVEADEGLVEKLHAQAELRRRAAALRAAGLSELDPEQLEAVLAEARARRS